ncbi:hypothetical protein X777_16316 [Ooceraea biroi]|uniref:Mutator-like transposase domain-containing protein n=1 Tax=Ooceraea biroi TaxID=2015173 RepID=A0A026VX32_OOCBI|nr:hypothetical protein X777_16316 [Ooceraea biroi]
MYPKGTKESSKRTAKPVKRKFYGNRFTQNSENDDDQSTNAKKLSSASSEDVIINSLHCYRIIEFLSVFTALADFLICRVCKQKIKFAESGHRGLGFKLFITCTCGHREINSGPLIHTGYEINRRIVFVMRLLGIGREGINIFCGLMDISQGISICTYDSIVKHIHTAARSVFDTFCKKAIEEEKEENVENGRLPNHLKVSGDGSWKKREFTSLYGVATLIGHYSGKIIDLVIKSRYCQSCTFWSKKQDTEEYIEWYEQHQEECSINHDGSAGKMKVDSI